MAPDESIARSTGRRSDRMARRSRFRHPWRGDGALLDDLELRPPRFVAAARRTRCRRRVALALREDHALAGFTRVDSRDRVHGQTHLERVPAEARAEADLVVTHEERG